MVQTPKTSCSSAKEKIFLFKEVLFVLVGCKDEEYVMRRIIRSPIFPSTQSRIFNHEEENSVRDIAHIEGIKNMFIPLKVIIYVLGYTDFPYQ